MCMMVYLGAAKPLMRLRYALPALPLSLLLAACGREEPPREAPASAPGSPAWAHVSKEQLAEAERLKVPVAFENSVEMRFVLIPPGTFEMGSTKGDSDEKPHTVTISEAFYMGITEVTQEQWQKVMGTNPSKFRGAELPVETVSWDDANAFVSRVNAMGGAAAGSLPTEARWEYACRAGTRTEWSFGDLASLIDDFAWTKQNAGETTHPVGTKRPNAWGLYDMHGNVWEWCADGPSGAMRMLRGGSWTNDARTVRSAFRKYAEPQHGYEYYGLRLMASIPKSWPASKPS